MPNPSGCSQFYLLWLDHTKGDNDPGYAILLVNAIFMLLYVIIAFLYKKDKIKIHFIVFLLFCVSCIECTMNMEETGYSTTGRSAYFKDYDSVQTLTDELSQTDDSFYRIAKAFGYRSKMMLHGITLTVPVSSHQLPMPASLICSAVLVLSIP